MTSTRSKSDVAENRGLLSLTVIVLASVIACLTFVGCLNPTSGGKSGEDNTDADSSEGEESSGELLPAIPLFGISQGVSRGTASSRLAITGTSVTYDDLIYTLFTPILTEFDMTNEQGIKTGETFTQQFFGSTVSTTVVKSGTNEYTYTSTLEGGKVVIVYDKGRGVFNYTQTLILLSDGYPPEQGDIPPFESVMLFRINDASLDSSTGGFQGIGKASLVIFQEGGWGQQSTKYEAYRGGFSTADDIGTGVFIIGGYNLGGSIIDVPDFDETQITAESGIALPFAAYEEYLTKVIEDPGFDSTIMDVYGIGYSDDDDASILSPMICYRMDGSDETHMIDFNEVEDVELFPDGPPDYPTKEDATAFLTKYLPAYWQAHKLLAFP